MWSDNETDRDFINFSGTATVVAKIIQEADGVPISIGVSGDWGVGKSSMIKLIKNEVSVLPKAEGKEFVFVEFNAWLYQGYDDARAALMDVIAATLEKEADQREKGIEKVTEFLKRVNWLRVARITGETAGALALGVPPGIASGFTALIEKMTAKEYVTADDFSEAKSDISELGKLGNSLIAPAKKVSPPKEIQALRNCFEESLAELGITLVVLIDDLDRCLPRTTISTLEAIRLFLFLDNTAFVIAADDKMIRHAVKQHFDGLEDALVTNYFDKLIQVPIRVPSMGIQEVRAYLFMLYIEKSNLSAENKEIIRNKVGVQLSQSWQGKRTDKNFISSLGVEFPAELAARIDTADRLAHIMTTAERIKGNPRLIKRFLNALSIRLSISNAQGVGVDEPVLVKLLLFERCAPSETYSQLIQSVLENGEGKPILIKDWEDSATSGKEFELPDGWNTDFVREWLTLPPYLSNSDLRGALYVSREHAPLLTVEDRLSSEAIQLLEALLAHPDMASSLKERLSQIQPTELHVLTDKVLEKAKLEQDWGTPPILDACLVMASLAVSIEVRIIGFLNNVPEQQITPSLVAKISEETWANQVFAKWAEAQNVERPTKAAIKKYLK